MKIKELISKLQEMPQDAQIVIAGSDGGANDIEDLSTVMLKKNVHDAIGFDEYEIVGRQADGDIAVLIE
jgi:hypothetical protein